jgi:hypothetical protein
MGFAEFANAPGHLWKEIASLKLQVIVVQISHALGSARVPRAGFGVSPKESFSWTVVYLCG